jgi:hypothetical protein
MNKFYLFILLLLCSCSGNENGKPDKPFPKTIRLEANKIGIKEIIKPVLITVLDTYLVIQNEYIPNHHCFFIYSLEDYKFLYSFGKLGRGPDEYIAPRLIQNSKDNILSVFDQASRWIHNFQITDTEPVLIEKNKIEDARKEPFQELSYLNDSIILLLRHDFELCSYNINESRFLEKFSFETDLKRKLGDSYKPSLESYHFSNYTDQIVIGHRHINKLSTGKIEKYGFSINNKELKSTNIGKDIYENISYYPYVTATRDHIFAQYYGFPLRRLQPFPMNVKKRVFNFYLEVYDWSLNPLILLEFDSEILRCTINEKSKTIYTWNPSEDFDYLLVYKYDFE